MSALLLQLAEARRLGRPFGIASVCSAHPTVLRAAIRRAKQRGRHVLIEATCNQVNHLGGYTGMTPADFRAFVEAICAEEGLAFDQVILGGDHLGPNPWRGEEPMTAMAKAEAMVEAYVAAGFGKLHLDTSMACAGESQSLAESVIAERAARLCGVAEAMAARLNLPKPLYVLGTEVPVPGGADHVLDTVEPTRPDAAEATIAYHAEIFDKAGLAEAFSRVIAFVVQPGVEFGSDNVIAYDRQKARSLAAVLENHPNLVFEAHSTDYQSREALRALVEDGFQILKVGPWLTFAYREALYGLDMIAAELVAEYGGRRLRDRMEALLTADPKDWRGHYHGDDTALALQRHYSYSDRIRYYWNRPEAHAAVDDLRHALSGLTIPETLFHQYLPSLASILASQAMEEILIAAFDQVLDLYDQAAGDPT
ncbi:D-tagatose-bisphosphate aldolase, class II, non-catalytic subunit [Rhizobium sp. G21]|uniref:D-tagatose-bisphosphate aldolase, class II, non-catalytic subunit n=1 Tax=Rhizobium sp. G21 TaxID=2758439 RepID=UPI0016039463|nr:D-tagatose-bisphosphate aldolase, class II, non-catalytic subunit [Rhizobium sp. G21]MBB1251514.1 D-tagatose-bisphosphate aldolase, class II, non-catalytic subunit [Rhizobium sp. G21]